jgi:hypothetical protein
MTLAAARLTLWAVRRLTRPVRDLAAAADRLGRDVNAPPLPENGPGRGRDRRARLQHHGRAHPPLRRRPHPDGRRHRPRPQDADHPPEAARRAAWTTTSSAGKIIADLEEMEAMIAATLAFARDDAAAEPSVAVDLAAALPHGARRGGGRDAGRGGPASPMTGRST